MSFPKELSALGFPTNKKYGFKAGEP